MILGCAKCQAWFESHITSELIQQYQNYEG